MSIDATIQARMGSSRLPGKVLKTIVGKPLLALQVERIRQSQLIDRVIITTSDLPQDDPIEALAEELGVLCYRGSENDVLGRVVAALKKYRVDLHLEFHGDSPLPDPFLIDTMVGFYLKYENRFDLVTNALRTTYPPGTEAWIYPAEVLFDAEKNVKDIAARESVSDHIYSHTDRYQACNLEAPPWLYYPNFYLEVDTPLDFQMVRMIFEHFYPQDPGFSLRQIIDFLLTHPEIAALNQHEVRRWKEFELQEDEIETAYRFNKGQWQIVGRNDQ